MKNMNKYENCLLCPRKCGINRRTGQTGVCGVSSEIKVARAALHYWEEPCISGKRGSENPKMSLVGGPIVRSLELFFAIFIPP